MAGTGSPVSPSGISWKAFWTVLGLGLGVVIIIATVAHYADSDVPDGKTVTMKVVENTTTRYGREITLADRAGDVTITVTGREADAILNAPNFDGGPNPQNEVRVTYVSVKSRAGKDPAMRNVLKRWRLALPDEMW
jgi:hypothetical protein